MKILVFGNIGSGKTTLAKRLLETLPFELTAVDDFRRTYGDGSKTGELLARKHFFESIVEGKNQLIECTGVGRVAEGLFEVINQMAGPVIVLTLLVPQAVCKLRIARRIWDIPFPHPLEKVDDLIGRTEIRIQEGAIAGLWNKRSNSLQLYRENNDEKDLANVVAELDVLAKHPDLSFKALAAKPDTGIDQMLSQDVQAYYSQAYASYQKGIIEKNPLFLHDRTMISNFIKQTAISSTLVDIGAGNCQWFNLLENKVSHYYALETNQHALDMAPQNNKLIPIHQNIFDPQF
ncbi:MAG TPA: AAA family ATPase, partial [Puia sp.]|nr:AAA family ATPase [Puia sp.]